MAALTGRARPSATPGVVQKSPIRTCGPGPGGDPRQREGGRGESAGAADGVDRGVAGNN